jgi:hypothetical protein
MWVEVRSEANDLLREPDWLSEVPSPGDVLRAGPDELLVLDRPTRTGGRFDEIEGAIRVTIVVAELVARPARTVPMPPRPQPRALSTMAA